MALEKKLKQIGLVHFTRGPELEGHNLTLSLSWESSLHQRPT